LKKFRTKDLFVKDTWIQGPNSTEKKGELKKIEVWRSIRDEIENFQDRELRWKVSHKPTFGGHLMLHLSSKQDEIHTILTLWHCTTPSSISLPVCIPAATAINGQKLCPNLLC
jgi:hypothetical protein